jgi:hypothetical protein
MVLCVCRLLIYQGVSYIFRVRSLSKIIFRGGLILRHRLRCGKREQAHDILKNDFGVNHVPSYLFGVNATRRNITALTMNVSSILRLNTFCFLMTVKVCYKAKNIRSELFGLIFRGLLLVFSYRFANLWFEGEHDRFIKRCEILLSPKCLN